MRRISWPGPVIGPVFAGPGDVRDWRGGVLPVSVLAALATGVSVVDLHKGAVLPEGRFIVLAVPCLALLFYLLVVRRRRDH